MQKQQSKQNSNILDNHNYNYDNNGVNWDDELSRGNSKQKETIVYLNNISFR
jgi:hypothetical protein